ncbi:MAG: dihydroxy-acid dehydratase, partial [Pseudomonadota bacterium]
MEVMGFHLPGAAFVNPGTELRHALTRAATKRAAEMNAQGSDYCPPGEMIDARSIVNAVVGLMATGGSTNHALHIPAMAAAAGYSVTLDDMADVSSVTPLLCRIYPNGTADVNHFHAAGGMGFLLRELAVAGLLQSGARTISGTLEDQMKEPWLDDGALAYRDPPETSGDFDILRPVADPFDRQGGLKLVSGPIGRGIIKTSAVKPENQAVEAPARVFQTQGEVRDAFKAGELDRDVVIVLRFQGPSANGMPELHGLSPILGSLQDAGHKVALVTDGRMSGASGKVPAAIHISPEGARGGPIARLRDGDVISLDGTTGRLELRVDPEDFAKRKPAAFRCVAGPMSLGRDMFTAFRLGASRADEGGSFFDFGQDVT